MPFDPEPTLPQNIGLPRNFTINAPEPEYEGATRTIAAAFRRENTVGSMLADERPVMPQDVAEQPDPSFDPWQAIEGTPYEDHYRAFAGAWSASQVEQIKAQIDRESQDAAILQGGGGLGVIAGIGAAILDPINLAPFGTAAKFGRGVSVLRGTSAGAGAGFVAGVGTEAALQSTQLTRSAEETAYNVAGSVFLGGAFGGGVSAFASRADRNAVSSWIDNLPDHFDEADQALRSEIPDGSLSAASARPQNLDVASEGLIRRIPIVSKQDPLIRGMLSPFKSVREATGQMAETSLEYRANVDGETVFEGGSVETMVKLRRSMIVPALRAEGDLYADYWRQGGGRGGGIGRAITQEFGATSRAQGLLSRSEFRSEISRAMSNGDVHEIPQVQQAAQEFRKFYSDALKMAQEVGLLDDISPEFAARYRPRKYNIAAVTTRRTEFAGIIKDHIKKNRAAFLAKSGDDVDEADAAFWSGLETDAELDEYVSGIVDNIASTGEMHVSYGGGSTAPLKRRVLDIPDEQILDFLEGDIVDISTSYFRSVIPRVEFIRRFGDIEMSQARSNIESEYKAMERRAGSDIERKRLSGQREAALRDLQSMRDRLFGTYALGENPNSIWMRAQRVALNLNYTRLLGGQTLSALPDVGKLAMVHGFASIFGKGIKTMISDLPRYKMAREEILELGAGIDMVMDSRAMAIGDVLQPFHAQSRFERGTQALADRFATITLMNPANAQMKQLSGMLTMNRILRASKALRDGTISKQDQRKLAQSGISPSIAARIADEFDAHGDANGDIWLAGGANWTNREAKEAFGAAINREVDIAVVTPGQDKPLWISTPVGKIIGQFKTFGFSSMQRTTLYALQKRDAHVFEGVTTMVALGALSDALKLYLAGQAWEEITGRDIEATLVNAFDRSGVSGWLMDASNTAGITRRLLGEQPTRYQTRNDFGQLLGPTADGLGDAWAVSQALLSGQFEDQDARALRKLIPLQNLFYLRWLFDRAQGGAEAVLPD